MEVEAELVTQSREDELLERAISRISLEPGVIAASWRVTEQEFG